MISYKTTKELPIAEVLALYNNAGWAAYTKEPDVLMQAIANSLDVFTAWEEDTLVGLVRVVGDGATIIYIQDILVLKAYKRKGIGRQLMQQLFNKYAAVRQKVLLTDDNAETRGFYESMGFKSCDDGKLVAFAKLSNQ